MALYEIEIKTLLGTKDNAESLKKKLAAHALPFSIISENKQLNHYFINGSIEWAPDSVEFVQFFLI